MSEAITPAPTELRNNLADMAFDDTAPTSDDLLVRTADAEASRASLSAGPASIKHKTSSHGGSNAVPLDCFFKMKMLACFFKPEDHITTQSRSQQTSVEL